MSKQAPDQRERDAIRTRLDETFLVEAGAGSGKTTSLVSRMVALISGGRCRMENMAAVTFTRKAAGELRERFQEKLERAYREESDPTVGLRLGEALSQLDRAFIGTIHSFCSRLLRERPVEAGLPPDFTEIEGLEEQLLMESAWEEFLLDVRLNNPALLAAVKKLDIGPNDMKQAYYKVSLYPDVTFPSAPTPYPELNAARKEIKKLLAVAEAALPYDMPDGGFDGLQRLLRQALRWRRIFNLDEDRVLLRLLGLLNKSPKPTLKKWPDKNTAQQINALFLSFRDNTARPVLLSWREYRYHRLLEFLLPAADHYALQRKRESRVNFQDLLMETAELLKNNLEVRAYFQQRFTHLLVDEFQDTDPIQAQVMMFLSCTDINEKDWTKLIPRPGALFVVGDPKQSIYRFRRADIDTYTRVREQIKAAGGEVLHLTANFRSLPALINWVNPAFDTLFPQHPAPYQAGPIPMAPFRENSQGTLSGVRKIVISPAYKNRQEEIVAEDAETIAAWVRHCLDGGERLDRSREELEAGLTAAPLPADFMILVRYKSKMAHYARALEKYGVAFTLSGGSDISESRELNELLFLLQALADPDNPVPLVAALRGLFFGLSDDQLFSFRRAGGIFSVHANLPGDAPAEIKTAFAPVLEKLRLYFSWSRELTPSAALENITTDLGLLPFALSGSMGKGRAGYILQLIELIRGREAGGEAGFADMVDYFIQLLDSGLEEELDISAGTSPGVRIMNLHKAKGLEAPIVILANPSKKVEREPDLHVRRKGYTPEGYLQICKVSKYQSEPLAEHPEWEAHKVEEARYRDAEEIRLLYVASTRAKNMLVVSTYPTKAELSPWQQLEAFLDGAEILEKPDVCPLQAHPCSEPVTPELLLTATARIQEELDCLAAPTYHKISVTDLSKAEEAPERFHTGKGASFGNVIHRALEVLAKEKGSADLNELIPAILSQEGRPQNEKESVIGLLEKIQQTELWQRAMASPELLVEAPFGIYVQNTYLTGVIDLAFRGENGWVLLDYKTDSVRDAGHLGQLARYYSPQVSEYARRWEEISGEKVVLCGLFFLDTLDFIRCTW
ncbi:MAG: UvrD-helicase domain-containing protein [Dethiobacter sp.]|jgi:ATP-dependent helicase/nuclease subunit A|nr:UvrD-helicase domain-containing protein [Dethiobacter sp.]